MCPTTQLTQLGPVHSASPGCSGSGRQRQIVGVVEALHRAGVLVGDGLRGSLLAGHDFSLREGKDKPLGPQLSLRMRLVKYIVLKNNCNCLGGFKKKKSPQVLPCGLESYIVGL